MLIKINLDLTTQEIWAEGNELVTILGLDRNKNNRRIYQRPLSQKKFVAKISNPILMTDIHAISKLEPTKRDTVFALYVSYPRTVEYDGVSVWWDPKIHTNVWCPSIDTVVFANAMRTGKGVLTENVSSAIDIGCASGFLGKYILYKCKNLKKLQLIDLNPFAIKCARDNVNRLNKSQTLSFSVADGTKISGRKFDLVACSPPYIPRPRSIQDNPYEGVGLLRSLIVNGRKYVNDGGKIILNVSSLCEKIKTQAVKEARKSGGLTSVKEIGKKLVPLKVNSILNNKEWISYLIKNGLKKTPKRGYEYWHEITILKLSYE